MKRSAEAFVILNDLVASGMIVTIKKFVNNVEVTIFDERRKTHVHQVPTC